MTPCLKKNLIVTALTLVCLVSAGLFNQGPDLFLEDIIIPVPLHGQTMPAPKDKDTALIKQDTEKRTTENAKTLREEGDSLYATLKKGGPLMLFIILLGIISLTIIIERLFYFTYNRIWKEQEIVKLLEDIGSRSKARYKEDLEDELREAFNLYSNKLERGLGLLSGIGNLAPIVGFLGTVIGMISAFAAIAAATTINAKVVAVGIQVALITTAGGLTIAAPTLGVFYLFSHVIQNRYTLADEIISNLTGKLPRLSNKLEDM